MVAAFRPSLSLNLSVTTTSASAALIGIGAHIRVVNAGTTPCYVALHDGSGSASTATGMLMLGNTVEVFSRGDRTHIAAITASGTTTLNVTTGEGL